MRALFVTIHHHCW